jgi:cation diffusion facilitator CzcD-associated flavoprotein CzcO
MEQARIVIVGAGLSGLYAAHLLERLGVADVVLLDSA